MHKGDRGGNLDPKGSEIQFKAREVLTHRSRYALIKFTEMENKITQLVLLIQNKKDNIMQAKPFVPT